MQTNCKQTQSLQDKIIKELDAAPNLQPFFWTSFEVDTLKKYYGIKDTELIAKLLNKPINNVRRKDNYLGLKFKR